MHATKAAAEEGIVTGGGVAYIRAARTLDDFQVDDPDEQSGVNIVRRALEEPLRQIANNAGLEGAIVVAKVFETEDSNLGFNAETGEYVNLVKGGVIDPTMVCRIALQNAASISSLLLTTEALVTEVPEDEAPAAPAHPPDMGGMGGF